MVVNGHLRRAQRTLVFFQRNEPTADRPGKSTPPDITAIAGMATENGTRGGGVGHLGFSRDGNWRYSAGAGKASVNVLPRPVAFEAADVFAALPAPAEVVLANLTGAMLIRSAAALTALVVGDGTLVVSGFMEYERPGVEAALDAFDVVARSQEAEWCAAVLRRR